MRKGQESLCAVQHFQESTNIEETWDFSGKYSFNEFYVLKHLSLLKGSRWGGRLPGGVGRRHMVLKCLGVVRQRSAEVVRGFPAEDALEFWDDG